MKLVKTIIRFIRKITPKFIFNIYHFLFAVFALIRYGNASKDMIVIGVTGTKGKSTTCVYIYNLLSSCGVKVGLLSTIEYRIGDTVVPNKRHMTMQGKGFVHMMLKRMKDAGCKYAVIETPSEGIAQYRNLGIKYDSVVFTNLSEEHLVTHKTYEKYRSAKGKLFSGHKNGSVKKIDGKEVSRFVVVNSDDKEHRYFLNKAESSNSEEVLIGKLDLATHRLKIKNNKENTSFEFLREEYSVPFSGDLQVMNVAPAIFFAKEYCNCDSTVIQKAIQETHIPGRLEEIKCGQKFSVFCDYAHEPLSIRSVYESLEGQRKDSSNKVIMIVGGVGANRWKYNAYDIGKISGSLADVTIITDVDPFFDNPEEIAKAVEEGVKSINGSTYHLILNRKEAINKAINIAQPGDVVIVTGKGSEVTMEVKGESIPWSDIEIVKKELNNL